MAFVFCCIEVTNHCFAQLFSLSIVLFSSTVDNSGLFTVMYNRVSSANSLTPHETSFTMSFTYMRNKRGPRTDPCGTPVSIAPQLDD